MKIFDNIFLLHELQALDKLFVNSKTQNNICFWKGADV